MKKIIIGLLLAVTTVAGWAQEQHKRHNNHEHPSDSTDVFFRHMSLNEVVVTGYKCFHIYHSYKYPLF